MLNTPDDKIIESLKTAPFPYALARKSESIRDILDILYTTVSLLNEKVYLFLEDLAQPPVCSVCKIAPAKFSDDEKQYRKTCGIRCNVIQRKLCCLEKYGVDNSSKSTQIKEKIKVSNIEKYGVDNPSKLDAIKEKKKTTTQRHYGVDNPFQSDEIKNKIAETNIALYGVAHPMHSEYVVEKVKATNLEKYGVECTLKIPEVSEKIKVKIQEKYGVDYPFQSKEWQDEANQIKLEKYGTIYPTQTEEIQNKTKVTNLERYGSEYIPNKHIPKEVFAVFDDKETAEQLYKNNSLRSLSSQFGVGSEFITTRFDKHGFIRHERSSFEREFKAFLEENKIKYISNDRQVLENKKELDFFLPDHNIAIEINGLFYHSEFKITDKNFHKMKYDICESKGIRLLTIFEDELIQKKEIVYNYVKNIVGINKHNKIYARKCLVKKISNKTAKMFLNTYHLQGAPGSMKISLGLFFENKLVSVMTFSKPRGTNGNDNIWELSRFTNANEKVLGAAGKLMNYFVTLMAPAQIISFADLRWSQGDLYRTLGFTEETIIDVDYQYVKNSKRYHKSNFSKQKLKSKGIDIIGKTEKEIMQELGYYRVWDCGKIRFIKNFKKLINKVDT